MNYEYTEEELSEFPNSVLEKIRVKYGLSKQDRDDLINNILTHQDFLEERDKRTPSISSKDISYFDNLPRDALMLVLFKLPYPEIAKKCKLSKKVNSLCNDEVFWKQYAENRGLNKDRESDTWKQTAILNYLGKYEPDYSGYGATLLGDLAWYIVDPPNNIYVIPKFVHNGQYIADPLEEKDYSKIVFRDPVKIAYTRYKIDPNVTTAGYNFELKPDTEVGSTLEHTLNQLYLKMYGLKDTDENNAEKSLEIYKNNFRIGRPQFSGFIKNKKGIYETVIMQ